MPSVSEGCLVFLKALLLSIELFAVCGCVCIPLPTQDKIGLEAQGHEIILYPVHSNQTYKDSVRTVNLFVDEYEDMQATTSFASTSSLYDYNRRGVRFPVAGFLCPLPTRSLPRNAIHIWFYSIPTATVARNAILRTRYRDHQG